MSDKHDNRHIAGVIAYYTQADGYGGVEIDDDDTWSTDDLGKLRYVIDHVLTSRSEDVPPIIVSALKG